MDSIKLKNGKRVSTESVEIHFNHQNHNKYITAVVTYAEYETDEELTDEDYDELNGMDDAICELIDYLEL